MARRRESDPVSAAPGTGAPRLVQTPPADVEVFSRTRADLESWRRGERAAFDRLWARYGPPLQVFIARKVRGVRNPAIRRRLEGEDVLQDAARIVLGKLRDFEYRGPGSLLAWMEEISERQLQDWIDRWEAAKRDPKKECSLEDGPVAPALDPRDPTPGPATSAAVREEQARLVESVARLPERKQRIVLLRSYFEATWEEIAEVVGAPSGDAARKEHAAILQALGRVIGRRPV